MQVTFNASILLKVPHYMKEDVSIKAPSQKRYVSIASAQKTANQRSLFSDWLSEEPWSFNEKMTHSGTVNS